jgi:hypothetical protein
MTKVAVVQVWVCSCNSCKDLGIGAWVICYTINGETIDEDPFTTWDAALKFALSIADIDNSEVWT